VIVGVIAVVGVIAYLVWQSGNPGSDDLAPAKRAEADSSADIPGQWIDLPAIYGGPYGKTAGHDSVSHDYTSDCGTTSSATATAEETPAATTPGITATAATTPGATAQATPEGEEVCNTNPPVGGPHWFGTCGEDPTNAPAFCGPAPWGIFLEPWDPESVVHNMEHGGVVIWYNTSDQDIIDELDGYVRPLLKDGDLLVMMPYPDMEDETIAVTSWSRIDKFPVSEYNLDRVKTFVEKNERRFNPEGL
jgi:hypothetical protein